MNRHDTGFATKRSDRGCVKALRRPQPQGHSKRCTRGRKRRFGTGTFVASRSRRRRDG
jgi:hypothetical protein